MMSHEVVEILLVEQNDNERTLRADFIIARCQCSRRNIQNGPKAVLLDLSPLLNQPPIVD